MEDVIRKREIVRKKVIKFVEKWAKKLRFPATVVLIGSYARGDFNLWSDVDVMLISDFSEPPVSRLMKIDSPPGFQIIALTLNEFKRLAERKEPLIIEAYKNGVVVRDDFKIFKNAKKLTKLMMNSNVEFRVHSS